MSGANTSQNNCFCKRVKINRLASTSPLEVKTQFSSIKNLGKIFGAV